VSRAADRREAAGWVSGRSEPGERRHASRAADRREASRLRVALDDPSETADDGHEPVELGLECAVDIDLDADGGRRHRRDEPNRRPGYADARMAVRLRRSDVRHSRAGGDDTCGRFRKKAES